MLEIKNIYKIIGEELDCKWLPNTKGWVVKTVEDVGDTYCFGLENGSIDGMEAQIQLRRKWEYKSEYENVIGVKKKKMCEIWAWDSGGYPHSKWCTYEQLSDKKVVGLWIGYILDKMLPH